MRTLWTLALAVSCASCSIHPLPQDVTGDDTYRIVQKIRCEARDAIESYVLGALDQSIPSDQEIARKLRTGELGFNFDRKTLSSDAQQAFNKYDQAAIAYDFTFNITEKNDVTANTDFLRTFGRGPFTVGIMGSSQLQRQNTRNFVVSDTFERRRAS